MGKADLCFASERMFGSNGQEARTSVKVSTQNSSNDYPVYVCYRDHVVFKNLTVPPKNAVLREAVGWVKEETDEVLLLVTDRAVSVDEKRVNGLVILKSCILERVCLGLKQALNAHATNSESEYALKPKERKTQ
ncbi:MAG: hypothetical protein NWF01_07990 [Candidatus Bathyarchaeota archaeon]|nr:hypothetical protein [Candidatus Bathyarchaeota archaeon]